MEKENHLDEKIQKWFTIYTKSRAEKKVFKQLIDYNYIAYLPLRKELREWKDRKKWLELPLFNSYIFVKVNTKEYYEIPKIIKGFVKYVSCGGQKISVREEEITTIKNLLDYSGSNLETLNEDLKLNEKVEIRTGQLKGIQGSLIEFRGSYKIAIRIDALGTNLLVQIKRSAVKKAN